MGVSVGVSVSVGVDVSGIVAVAAVVAVTVAIAIAVAVGVGAGVPTQLFNGELQFRECGAPAAKSRALLFASMLSPPARKSAVALLGAGAGPEPSKQLAVDP